MKYLNVANPYPYVPPDYGLINPNNIISIMFTIIIVLILLKKYVSWYSKRTIYLGDRKPNGWKYGVPFYRVHCNIHGFYETSRQGWEQELRCPECISEREDKKARTFFEHIKEEHPDKENGIWKEYKLTDESVKEFIRRVREEENES